MEGTSNTELLVLSDEQGNTYAIPRDVLEQHKVTGEQKAQIDQAMGEDEVSGYSMYQYAMNAARAQEYGETARKEAADARLVRAAKQESVEVAGGGASASSESPSTPSNTFFGRFVSVLGVARPKTS